MKRNLLVLVLAIIGSLSLTAQNLNSDNGGYNKKQVVDGKKFRVIYYEYEVERTPEDVWAEVAGNYVNVGEIHQAINESHCESGDTTSGIGAARYCSVNFGKKEVQIKERITDFTEETNRMEYTYEVYDSKGFPAKVYNTWVVRVGDDGKTYLGNAFFMRGKPSLMTGMLVKRLTKLGGVRNSVLAYKHFLETGEKKVDPEIFDTLYPEAVVM